VRQFFVQVGIPHLLHLSLTAHFTSEFETALFTAAILFSVKILACLTISNSHHYTL